MTDDAFTPALRSLADATEFVSTDAARSIRGSTLQFELAAPNSVARAELAKQALVTTLQALTAADVSSSATVDFERAVGILAAAVDTLSSTKPLRDQQADAALCFRAATDAVFLARGGEPPFGALEADDGEGSIAGDSPSSDVEAARAQTLAFAQSRWTNVRKVGANTLSAIADVVSSEARRRHVSGARLDQQISSTRFQAERLRRSDGQRFGASGWIKTGLTASLDALDSLAKQGHGPSAGWIRAARLAVSNIEDRSSLAFQQPIIQDALRATVDALAALLIAPNPSR